MFEEWLHDLKNPMEACEFEGWVEKNNNIVKRMHANTLGNVFLILVLLIDLAYMVLGRQNKWLTAGILICLLVFLLLPIFAPAYFTLKPRRYGAHTFPTVRYSLGVPFFLHMYVLLARTASDFNFLTWGVFGAGILTALIITGAMLLLAKEFRVRDWLPAAFLVVMLLCGIGVVGQLNYLLDAAPGRAELAEIVDVDFSAGTSGRYSIYQEFTRYECTVELANGLELSFKVPFRQTDGMWLGNKVAVEYHEGGLGLEYVSIKGVFDLGPK